MKETLKILIEEFQDWTIPNPVIRSVQIPQLPPEIRKAYVMMGVRRCGKTWIMYQHMHEQLRKGLSKDKLLYLNFEDDRLNSFSSENFQNILDAYFDLYPQYVNSKELLFFFDEIHVIPGWEKFIRRLLDKEQMQVFVTGSSAKMLSSEIATTLRGRAWTEEIFPFSLSEFVSFKGVVKGSLLNPKKCSQLRSLTKEYLVFGGFPEALMLPKELHSSLLQGYMNTIIFRDIIERHKISNVHCLKLFLLHCLNQIAAPLSVNKVFNSLKSQGESIGKNSLFEFLEYFQDAYALFCVPIFSFSERVRQVNPKKIYAVDTGFITAYSIKHNFEDSARLENAVFIQLRKLSTDIFYYVTAHHHGVDFIIITSTGGYELYQVCLEMTDTQTRDREFRAITEAAQELNLQQGLVITGDYEETILLEGVTITCVPFWKWAYMQDSE